MHPSELESEDFMTEVREEGGCSHQCQPNSTQLVVKLNCCHAATASHYSQNSLILSSLISNIQVKMRKGKENRKTLKLHIGLVKKRQLGEDTWSQPMSTISDSVPFSDIYFILMLLSAFFSFVSCLYVFSKIIFFL